MLTEAEKKFNDEYKLVRLLFFSGSKITPDKAKNWIRTKGASVLKEIDKELMSDSVKKLLSRQFVYNTEYYDCIENFRIEDE